MSNLKVEINYNAIASLVKGIRDQMARKDYKGLEGSVNLLCKQLDKAAITVKEGEKNEKISCLVNRMRSFLGRCANRLRKRV